MSRPSQSMSMSAVQYTAPFIAQMFTAWPLSSLYVWLEATVAHDWVRRRSWSMSAPASAVVEPPVPPASLRPPSTELPLEPADPRPPAPAPPPVVVVVAVVAVVVVAPVVLPVVVV